MDLVSAASNLLSGASGAAIIVAGLKAFTVWEKKKGRGEPLPAYKNKFFEELSDILKAHTDESKAHTAEIRRAVSHFEKYDPIILAVDQNNYPKVWSDHEQQRRTHEVVGNTNEAVEEIAKTVTGIRRKFDE